MVQTAAGKSHRVEVQLDLQERFVFIPSGIVPDVIDSIDSFVSKLSEVTASQLALMKWDGTDQMTQYQSMRLLPGYRLNRSYARFDVLFEEVWEIAIDELNTQSIIQL